MPAGSATWHTHTASSATSWWRRKTLDDAFKAYRDGLAIAERLTTRDGTNAQWQHTLRFPVINKMGDLAYRFVLAGNFPPGSKPPTRPSRLHPKRDLLYTNRAHSLMFLGRVDEARASICNFAAGDTWMEKNPGRT